MALIVVTSPAFLPREGEVIARLFETGLDLLHLRKPDATIDEVRRLVETIPTEYRKRIVVHDFFSLKDEFCLGGIHLNSRHTEAPAGYQGLLSRACHSLEEVKSSLANRRFNYVLLSPVYDSISKQGYRSGYTREELRRAQAEGIINEWVIAMGGITANRLPEIRSLGFGGAAILGDLWKHYQSEADTEKTVAHFKNYKY